MLENFFYDGAAPGKFSNLRVLLFKVFFSTCTAGFFGAVRGSSVSSNNYWLVPDEAGRLVMYMLSINYESSCFFHAALHLLVAILTEH